MSRQEIKIKITEQFKQNDINARKETLEKILYKLIKNNENNIKL